jgi:hypothetical protein
VSTRTPTLPPTEPAMWRKLLARTHPDAGGTHELFIWTMNVRETICDGRPETDYSYPPSPPRPEPKPPHSKQDQECVPFDKTLDFDTLPKHAVEGAETLPEPYASVLLLLRDCHFSRFGSEYDHQYKGATYKQLAAIGHKVSMDKGQRVRWYRIAESIPLSRRHAGHILGKLAA